MLNKINIQIFESNYFKRFHKELPESLGEVKAWLWRY